MLIRKELLRHSGGKIVTFLGYGLYSVLYPININVANICLKIFGSLWFCSPGMFGERYGYNNVHVEKFCYLVQERYRIKKLGLVPTKKNDLQIDNERIKVGVFGGLATPNKELFIHKPENVELYIYDVSPYDNLRAPWLKDVAFKYFSADVGENCRNLVKTINADNLDLLIHIGSISTMKDIVINQSNASRIIVYNTGTSISFNEKVDFDLMHQPQLFCSIRNDLFYCDYIDQPFSQVKAIPFEFVFNHCNIDLNLTVPLNARKKQIVFHGNLYKLNNKYVLKIIADLLERYTDYSFVFMGCDQKPALRKITGYFKKRGVGDRVSYLGNMRNRPDDNGIYQGIHTGLYEIIRESRLYVDPWPIDGGNTVFQAYALGVPCVSLKMNNNQKLKKLDKTQTTVELNGFVTDMGPIACTPEEYKNACIRIIEDDAYAEKVLQAQLKTAKQLGGEAGFDRFWRAVLEAVKS